MSSALRLAREAVATGLSTALPTLTVIDHEPPALTSGTTITVSTAGMTATEYLITVRVYVNDVQPEAAQDTLDDTVPDVDGALSAARSDWEFGYDEARASYLATTTVDIGREDF